MARSSSCIRNRRPYRRSLSATIDATCSSCASAFAAVLRTMISTRFGPGYTAPLTSTSYGGAHTMPQSTSLTRTSAITPTGGSISARYEWPRISSGSASSEVRGRGVSEVEHDPGSTARGRAGRPCSGRSPSRRRPRARDRPPTRGAVRPRRLIPGRRTAPASRPAAAPGAADHDHHPAPASARTAASLNTITVPW